MSTLIQVYTACYSHLQQNNLNTKCKECTERTQSIMVVILLVAKNGQEDGKPFVSNIEFVVTFDLVHYFNFHNIIQLK